MRSENGGDVGVIDDPAAHPCITGLTVHASTNEDWKQFGGGSTLITKAGSLPISIIVTDIPRVDLIM